MKQPKWIIEDFAADNKFDLIAAEAKAQGMEVKLLRDEPIEEYSFDHYEEKECVIVLSSLELANKLQNKSGWIPGPWLNSDAYQCTQYYAYLGKYLMNKDYFMLPRAEVKRRWTELIELFGKQYDALFIRPSSGHKTFTGKVYQTKNFEKDWEWVEEFTDPGDIVIISSVKTIEKEWRFIATEDEIITGSLYRQRIGGAIMSGKYREIPMDWEDLQDEDDRSALSLAIQVAHEKYYTNPLYSIDISKTENGAFHLLEIGSFSCAGLYDCNPEIIVKHATRLAQEEWKDFYPDAEE